MSTFDERRQRIVDHVGGDADLIRQECDAYGLPHDLHALLRHLYGNMAAIYGAQNSTIDTLKAKLEASRGPWIAEVLDQVKPAVSELERERDEARAEVTRLEAQVADLMAQVDT